MTDMSADATLAATLSPDDDSIPSRRPRSPSLARGEPLGRYMVLSELGAGGMGVVYAAYDPKLDRKIALKLLRHRSDEGDAHERLEREALALAKLDHPNVVAVHDVGVHAGQLFVAMEFVAGETLGAWMHRAEANSSSRASAFANERELRAVRPWREVLEVFAAAGRGLAAAHEAGMVHRDFKPDNVMISADGRVRVMDFGLARSERGSWAKLESSQSRSRANGRLEQLTQTGAMMGTPAYMSLEQFEAGRVDARSDQFSFCVALYEALYGERPFAAQTVHELVHTLQTGELPAPPRRTKVPSWVRAVVVRGLSKDAAARHDSMDALLDALANDPVARWRRRGMWAGVATLSLSGVGALSQMSGEVAERDAVIEEQADELELKNAQLERQLAAQTELLSASRGLRARALIPKVREREALSLAIEAVGAYAGAWEQAPRDAVVGLEHVLAHDTQVITAAHRLTHHSDFVSQVEFSPDGALLASSSIDGSALLWSVERAEPRATLDGHEGSIDALAFRPDGAQLATAGADGSVRLWGIDGTLEATLDSPDPLVSLAYSPDGSRVAAAPFDGHARVWDVRSGAQVAQAPRHERPRRALSFAPDGSTFVTISDDGYARIWSADTGALVRRIGTGGAGLVAAAFSPDGTRLATAGIEPVARLWEVASGKLIAPLEGHDKQIPSIQFSPDGGQVLTSSWDTSAAIYDARTGARIATLAGGHNNGIPIARYSLDGERIVSGSFDGSVVVWDVASHQARARLVGHKGDAWVLAWSPDGERIATGSADTSVRVWGVERAKVVVEQGPETDARGFAYAPDGSALATVDSEGWLRIWTAEQGDLIATLAQLEGLVWLDYSPDGRWLVASHGADGERETWAWDAHSLELALELELSRISYAPDSASFLEQAPEGLFVRDVHSGARLTKQAVRDVSSWSFAPDSSRVLVASKSGLFTWERGSDHFRPAFEARRGERAGAVLYSPDGRQVAMRTDTRTIEVWDAQRESLLYEIEVDKPSPHTEYSPKGTYLISYGRLSGSHIWDASNGQLVRRYIADVDSARITQVMFSPDERRLVVLGDRRVTLHDARTGERLHTLDGHELGVRAEFSADGGRLITHSAEQLRIWDVETGTLLTRERIGLARPDGSVDWPLHPRELTRIGCARLQVFSRAYEAHRDICEPLRSN